MKGRKKKEKRHPVMKTILVLAGIGILSFTALMGYVCIREGQVQTEVSAMQEEYDAVIVLGAQVKPDGTPSVQLSWRLDKAYDAWEHRNVPVVVCGAQGKDEPETEASAMKRYLIGRGIPEERILMEPDSVNTQQNLAHAKELLAQESGSIRKVLIVTSDYHVPRAMALAEDLGMEAAGIGSPCLKQYWLKNHGREALAWIKYWLNKYLKLNL